MPSAAYNDFTYDLARGDDRTFTAVAELDGAAQNITGWSIWVTGKAALDNDALDAAALFQYSIGAGVTVTNAATGTWSWTLAGADTDALTADTTINVDIQYKNAAGAVWTAATGKLTFYREVTRRRV